MTETEPDMLKAEADALGEFNRVMGPHLLSYREPYSITRDQLEALWVTAFSSGALWAVKKIKAMDFS